MNALAHAHSGLRWIALILIVYAIINALLSKNKGEYLKKNKDVIEQVRQHFKFE